MWVLWQTDPEYELCARAQDVVEAEKGLFKCVHPPVAHHAGDDSADLKDNVPFLDNRIEYALDLFRGFAAYVDQFIQGGVELVWEPNGELCGFSGVEVGHQGQQIFVVGRAEKQDARVPFRQFHVGCTRGFLVLHEGFGERSTLWSFVTAATVQTDS